jgi:hypothetical protein
VCGRLRKSGCTNWNELSWIYGLENPVMTKDDDNWIGWCLESQLYSCSSVACKFCVGLGSVFDRNGFYESRLEHIFVCDWFQVFGGNFLVFIWNCWKQRLLHVTVQHFVSNWFVRAAQRCNFSFIYIGHQHRKCVSMQEIWQIGSLWKHELMHVVLIKSCLIMIFLLYEFGHQP